MVVNVLGFGVHVIDKILVQESLKSDCLICMCLVFINIVKNCCFSQCFIKTCNIYCICVYISITVVRYTLYVHIYCEGTVQVGLVFLKGPRLVRVDFGLYLLNGKSSHFLLHSGICRGESNGFHFKYSGLLP